MVKFINNILSYDFLPDMIKFLKTVGIYTLIAFGIFAVLALFAYFLKDKSDNTILKILAGITVIALTILVIIFLVIVSLIPTLFCIISIKYGIIEVFGFSEIVAGLMSSVFCILIYSLLCDYVVFNEK